MQTAFAGVGAKLMAAAILVSTFGCVNGLLLAGARVYYAMSQDGLFFKSVGKLDEKTKTPVNSLWLQCVWACLLCLSGQYGNLLDYVIFAVLVFYVLTIGGLFVLRRTRPEAPRPYKAFGYPVLPALYIVMAVWICGVLLRYKPQYTWPGLILVLLGVPVYLVWTKRSNAERSSSKRNESRLLDLGERERMANLLAIKPMSMLMNEAQAGGRARAEAVARAAEPDHAGNWSDHRRGHLRANRCGRCEACGTCGGAEFRGCGLTCAFAGLCYAEFASLIPIAGSAYTYGYATLGEFVAWIIGWELVLEYAFGAATVASGWSGYLVGLLADMHITIPPQITATPGVCCPIPEALGAGGGPAARRKRGAAAARDGRFQPGGVRGDCSGNGRTGVWVSRSRRT